MPSTADTTAQVFEQARPRLRRLAYRMLGSVADAEDAVQDTYLRWRQADRDLIEVPEAWLTTTCTRRCLDLLRAAHRSRVDYVGPWLPEPIMEPLDYGNEAELAASLSTAFLLLLECLTPNERAAFLLREVFDADYADVAAALDKNEAACRQLVARARKHVGGDRSRFEPAPARAGELLDEFLAALQSGDLADLQDLLAEDVELWGDGGGKVIAARNVLHGISDTARFLAGAWKKVWSLCETRRGHFNGGPGLLIWHEGTLHGALSLAADDSGRITGVYIVRNPEKLAHLSEGA